MPPIETTAEAETEKNVLMTDAVEPEVGKAMDTTKTETDNTGKTSMQIDDDNNDDNKDSTNTNTNDQEEKEMVEMNKYLDTIEEKNKSKQALVKSSLRAILKMLQNLRKKPEETKYRKMRTKNIIVQKYVTGVEGALAFMQTFGFRVEEDASKKKPIEYLLIDEDAAKNTDTQSLLDQGIAVLQQRLNVVVKVIAEKKKKPSKRVQCEGGCGFWGEEKTENMCSLCYRKKYFAGGSSASSSASSTTATTTTTTTTTTAAASSGAPAKCVKACGMYGSAKFKGMCSVCWKEHGDGEEVTPGSEGKATDEAKKKKEEEEKEKTKMKREGWKHKFRLAKMKVSAVREFIKGVRPKLTHKSRCHQCRKKVGISGFECRCRYIFCSKHRHAGKHGCSYDFKKDQRKKLDRENKKVVAPKFERIQSDI